MIRLIACDLDGTLLREKPPVSERNRKALARAQKSGMTVVLVSARHPRDVGRIAGEVGIRGTAICINGALIYDLDNNRVIKYEPLSRESIQMVVRAVRERLPGATFHWEQEKTFGREPAFEKSSRRSLTDQERAIRTLMDIAELAEPVAKLIMKHPELRSSQLLTELAHAFDDTVLLTSGDQVHVEITAAGVHKGAALEWLSQQLGIRSNEVIAFGDMPNDIPMLTWAGRGVAMGNADPSVKEIADEVTGTNLEDGVAQVLERLLVDQEGPSTRSRKSTALG